MCRDFKAKHDLDKVIVLWTANTERFSSVLEGLNDTKDNLMAAIERGDEEIAPSTLFAVASILEGSPYINGSPQNTFVPGVIELAEEKGVLVAGDDFKSGQTKMKSVLVDFLVGAGLKPESIVSYNHLGNNDGKNLSAPQQFRSKEISKSNVVDDMVHANQILYKVCSFTQSLPFFLCVCVHVMNLFCMCFVEVAQCAFLILWVDWGCMEFLLVFVLSRMPVRHLPLMSLLVFTARVHCAFMCRK